MKPFPECKICTQYDDKHVNVYCSQQEESQLNKSRIVHVSERLHSGFEDVHEISYSQRFNQTCGILGLFTLQRS